MTAGRWCRRRAVMLALAAVALGLAGRALAAVPADDGSPRLAGIFGDHMVLQRGVPIRIWGFGAPGQTLQVQFRGERKTAMVGPDGRWQVRLRAAPAGGPHELRLQAAREQVLRDIVVGDLWLCAGQSNMEWTVGQSQDAAQEIAAGEHPLIRSTKVAHRAALQPQHDLPAATWQAASPSTVAGFSGVGYFFARRLQRDLKVPIGLIDVSWGGTHAETWTAREALARSADFAPIVRALPATAADWAQQRNARVRALVDRWQPGVAFDGRAAEGWQAPDLDDSAWRGVDVPGPWESQGLDSFDGVVWFRREFSLDAAQAAAPATLHLGAIDDCDETWVNGVRIGGVCQYDQPRVHTIPPGHLRAGRNVVAVRVTDTGGGGGFWGDAALVRLEAGGVTLPLAGRWKARVESALARDAPDANDLPSLAFDGMVRPLLPMRIRGVIWYQGESNVGRAAQYGPTFRRLINDWRRQWAQPDLPFLYVQLAAYLPLRNNTLAGSEWAELRDAQRQALSLPQTGMVVATDLGDPDDIHPRDKQEVGRRLALLAMRQVHGRPVVAHGPVFRSMTVRGGQAVLRFVHTDGGLLAAGSDGVAGTARGFAIAGRDGVFRAASARVEGSTVRVWSDDVPQPVAVRFGWVDNPQENNLVNRAGLPASPFRTDRWPLRTEGRRYGL